MKEAPTAPGPGCLLPDGGFRTVRRRPVNLEPADLPLFAHELDKSFPAARIQHLADVDISADSVLSQGSRVLVNSFPDPALALRWQTPKARLKLFLRSLPLTEREIIEHGIWFTDTQGHEYFHWMADSLPSLLRVGDELPGSTILLPGRCEGVPYIAGSLRTFDIGRIQYVHHPARCRRLTLSPVVAPSGNHLDKLLQDLRDHMRTHFAAAKGKVPGERLYISRARAPKRKVVNEAEVIQLLESFGYQTVFFEDHDFEQQASIAAAARHIVSIHGAGLTNMLFMANGGRILELRKKDDNHNNCYFTMASALGHDYYYQLCEATDPAEDAFSANLTVNLDRLERNLELMEKT